MSPVAEPTVLDLRLVTLRQIGPKAVIFPDALEASVTVLNRSDLVARPLPVAMLPSSPDFVSGQWTGRVWDAGDGQLDFPNTEASDGVPWRYRWDPTNKLQWVEIYLDEYLDSVLCVTKVVTDREKVTVQGYDGYYLTKDAYTRDWTCVQSPRDVIERGTQLWMPTTTDAFPAGALAAQWTPSVNQSSTVAIGHSGGLVLTAISAVGLAFATVTSTVITVPGATGTWRAQCSITNMTVGTSSHNSSFDFTITESSGDTYDLQVNLAGPTATIRYTGNLLRNGSSVASSAIQLSTSYDVTLESDGEWVWAFVNGQLCGVVRRNNASTTSLKATMSQAYGFAGTAASTVTGILVEALQPFLMRGTDKGDYVLPGTAATYPSGGLHARYYNDLDLASDTNRILKIMNPSRSQAYAGSGPSEYANQQDATINTQANPTPGAATSNWSAKWFGAVYLKLSAGNYTFQWNNPGAATTGIALRIWIGKTKFGDQLVDSWTFASGSSSFSFTVSAATLAGALSYGGGTVQRDGWYPIKVEYAVDSTARVAGALFITNSPAAYTDPGGTAVASGAQATVVPATSLSPLGCVDNRFQGVAHFDMVQSTLIGFGYQASLEPKELESGLFPGVLAPRIREGTDYDAILEPDNSQRSEGLINYSSTVDGTDQASSIQGNGAGFQNGTVGQLSGFAYDPPTLQQALFDMQAWQDASDASFLSLLDQILNSQLGLRLQPWSLVAGDPSPGRHRLAYTWPMTQTVAAFRWRPGDGGRIHARDINVFDTVPRQLLLITRQIQPTGITSTQVGFAARPKGNVYAQQKALKAALRPQRNYQRQLVTLTGTHVLETVAAGVTTTGLSILALSPGDLITRARLRINANTGPVAANVIINSIDQTFGLNGPWSGQPVNLDIGPVASLDSFSRIYVAMKNGGGIATTFDFQLLLEVLR